MAKRKRFVSQATSDAIVRFGPELSGLRELVNQAYQNRDTAVRQAHGTSLGIVNAVDQARPTVRGIYDQAGLTQARTAHSLAGEVSAIPGVDPSIAAGAVLEQATGVRHLNEARSAALTDLGSRRVAAKEGEQFAVQNAQTGFVHDLAQVLARKQSLAQERGAFISSETGKLRDAKAARDTQIGIAQGHNLQSERNSLRSAGIDPNTGQPIPGGKLDPKAKSKSANKPRTDQQHEQALSTLSGALSALKTLDPQHDPSNWGPLGDLLQQGHKGQPIYTTDSTGKRIPKLTGAGTPVVTPDIPKTSNLWAHVALQVYYKGYVDRPTIRRLRALGYSVGTLNLPTRPRTSNPQSLAHTGIGGAQQIAQALGGLKLPKAT